MGIRRRLTPEQLRPFSRYIAKASADHPRLLPLAISLAATGHHCEKFTRQQTVLRGFKDYLKLESAAFHEGGRDSGSASGSGDDFRRKAMQRAARRRNAIPGEFRFVGDGVREALAAFELAMTSEPRPAGRPEANAAGPGSHGSS